MSTSSKHYTPLLHKHPCACAQISITFSQAAKKRKWENSQLICIPHWISLAPQSPDLFANPRKRNSQGQLQITSTNWTSPPPHHISASERWAGRDLSTSLEDSIQPVEPVGRLSCRCERCLFLILSDGISFQCVCSPGWSRALAILHRKLYYLLHLVL